VLATPATAAFPGKNGRIAFVRDGDIWTVKPDGTGLRRVTKHPAFDDDPAWSPNGRWIAFTRSSGRYWGDDAVVYRIRPDGTGLRRITAGAQPSWAPDGRRIAFRDVGQDAIWIGNTDGTGRRPLTGLIDLPCDETGENDEHKCRIDHPAWGPFGRSIAFSWGYAIDSGSAMARVNASDAGEYQSLGTGRGWGGDVQDYSPDGAWIAFAEYDEYRGISSVGLVGWRGKTTRLVVEVRGGEDPNTFYPSPLTAAWAPDGKRVVVGPADAVGYGDLRLRTMNPDGTRVRYLSRGENPSWQPLPR
jgi:Tol biopolymer transport system component